MAQLLVLLDGMEARSQIFVLVTTNRPEHVDPALRQPGRFDQVVWMGPPDGRRRADISEHYLRGLKLDSALTPDHLAAELANASQGFTGADTVFLCQRAAMCCVKDAVGAGEPNDPPSPATTSMLRFAFWLRLAPPRAAASLPRWLPHLHPSRHVGPHVVS